MDILSDLARLHVYYRFMNNATINKCSNRSSENIPWWDAELFANQVIPFVDMTVKGWVSANNIKTNCPTAGNFVCDCFSEKEVHLFGETHT